MMKHINAFKANTELLAKYPNNAHLIWAMGLYLDNSNLDELASECLTDQTDDKKIDFIKLDLDNKKIVVAQGYYSERKVDSAPANKASDLNAASAWITSGDTKKIPEPLKSIIIDCREAIEKGEIEQIDLLYVHNLSESVPVLSELKTVAKYLENCLKITTVYKEIGLQSLEEMYMQQQSAILVREEIVCPAQIKFEEHGQNWSSAILSVSGGWLRELYKEHGDKLFSANYRGFLGISKRKKINMGIKSTAEKHPDNFWAYNNGITILTNNYESIKNHTTLTGVSIINGAQTTGSIGSLDLTTDISNVKILCRLIKCENEETINEIVKYNNTQNEITTWDKFSNDPNQKTIQKEFSDFSYSYSLKRGFNSSSDQLGIEQVAQSLLALKGRYQDANRGKNNIFENNALYKLAFDNAKARHILLAYCIARSIDERRSELKRKHLDNKLIGREEKQLTILRNLRFKYFFISIFGRCLDEILDKKIEDINLVGFDPNFIRHKKINDLIVEILPAISMVLTYTANIINGNDFSELLAKDPLEDIANNVGSLIYSIKSSGTPVLAFDDFKKIVSYK